MDAALLSELAANGGAVLCWQTSDESAFAEAAARGVVTFDEDADCFVHPGAVKVGDGAWELRS